MYISLGVCMCVNVLLYLNFFHSLYVYACIIFCSSNQISLSFFAMFCSVYLYEYVCNFSLSC